MSASMVACGAQGFLENDRSACIFPKDSDLEAAAFPLRRLWWAARVVPGLRVGLSCMPADTSCVAGVARVAGMLFNVHTVVPVARRAGTVFVQMRAL